MDIRKCAIEVDVAKINLLLDEFTDEWGTQLSVTSRNGNDHLDGFGRITDYQGSREWDFNKLNDYFVGTVVDTLISDLKNIGLLCGRVRFMRMSPKSCYSYHMDCEERLHIPLQNADQCKFILDDQVINIPLDGCGYILNTTKPHSAINFGDAERIHLVVGLVFEVVHESGTHYVNGREYNDEEFNAWLVETKPHTEARRMDYYEVCREDSRFL